MRIGIDARPLQLDAYRRRGIGAYTRSWIEAAQRLASPGEFVLYCDPALPPPQVGLTSAQWSLRGLDLPALPGGTLRPDAEFAADGAFEAFCLAQRLDLFHATYTLMDEVFVPRRLHETCLVATFYDLIPLLYRHEYLAHYDPAGRECFARRVGAAVYAQRVQTISRATRDDLVGQAGISPAGIDVIHPGVEAAFRPLDAAATAHELAPLGIAGPYLFSITGAHASKNLGRLLEAYRLLAAGRKNAPRLVVRCPLSPPLRAELEAWAARHRLGRRVLFLDREVSQAQLVALYNGASLLAHVSLYEGAGLPIVEAMRCGTPVVASNTSSMPEMAGGAAVLVDPLDPPAIAQGMARLLDSRQLRDELRQAGFEHSRAFTWDNAARGVLDSYAQALPGPPEAGRRLPAPGRASRRLRLAVWSPLNPQPSGVSDYAEHLVAAISQAADVDVFLDGYQPSNLPLLEAARVFDYRAYRALAAARRYDLNLYQVGNNPLHRYLYDFIFETPGIVTLHDITLYYLIRAAAKDAGEQDAFWSEVAWCEGDAAAHQARLDDEHGRLDRYRLPLNRRIVQASRGVVVHSQWGLDQIQQYAGAPPARRIPFGMPALSDDGGRFGALARQALGLPARAFIFGAFGNLHPVKRLDTMLRALARVRSTRPDVCLYLMGPDPDGALRSLPELPPTPAAQRAQGLYLHPYYASYELMLMAMQAVDAGINLRFPTAGETSGTLSMLLGAGRPTIVSDVGSFAEYPDACCFKTPVSAGEVDTLARHMLALAGDAACHQRASRAAHAYSRDKTWRNTADQYLSFVEDILTL